ncbi:PadR family transcriptional regulator [Thermotoga sp.]|uniref:PadR family transcriptional regulator n=1 Tax=Thermotoga sp. TaxID=28240 RepID=UPI0025D67B84|nr:PadR family transcriptional regulator [Thermotoga sp.]MCD6551148.1 PadR family transcriptional regulator [Thermotoga sp.]
MRFRGGRGFQGWWIASALLLLIAERPSHGYELAERLSDFGIEVPGIGHMGNIYRVLANLEESGLVFTEWDTSGSPPRKVYRITPQGKMYLRKTLKSLEEMKERIEILERRIKRALQL